MGKSHSQATCERAVSQVNEECVRLTDYVPLSVQASLTELCMIATSRKWLPETVVVLHSTVNSSHRIPGRVIAPSVVIHLPFPSASERA